MSNSNVQLTSAAIRGLDRVPPRIVPAIVEFHYGPLAVDPARVGKPLRGEFAGLFSARRGDYRVIYEIQETSMRILVHRVAHRSEAYRS